MALALNWLLDTGRAYRYDFVGDAPLATLSATFDANWFASIATDGYSRSADVTQQQNYHFFPLFPAVMRAVGMVLGLGGVQGGYNLAGVVVSHLCFFAALVALFRLTRRVFRSDTIASYTIWIAAFAPWSFVFSMAYTEALFLLLSVLAVLVSYDARTEMHPAKVAAAALLVALAALTRPQGVVLALPVIILLVTDGRARTPVRRLSLAAALIAPSAIAVAGFVLYIGQHTGNFWALLQVNRTWGHGWLADAARLVVLPPANPMWFVDVMAAFALLIWAALAAYQVRMWARPASSDNTGANELRWVWLIYSLVFFAFTLLANPSNGGWGRYMITVLPNIWIVAIGIHSASASRKRMLLMVSLTLQVLLLACAVLLQLTP
jgi:hypothetical protein